MALEDLNHLLKAGFLDLSSPDLRTTRDGLGSPAWSAGGHGGLVSSLLGSWMA